jgi:hypothetical protein
MITSNKLIKPATHYLLALALGMASAAHAADMMQIKTVAMTSLAAPQMAATLTLTAIPNSSCRST